MEQSQLIRLQEAVLNNIFLSESIFHEFSMTQNAIPIWIFGKYQNIAKLAYGKTFDDLQITKISTEIVKLWEADLMAEILNTPFYAIDFYTDIKILIKEYIMASKKDDYDKLIDIEQRVQLIDRKKASNASEKYLISNLYDNAIEELAKRAERKKKGLYLWFSTWFPLLDRYTEGIQKWTLMRLNAYSNVGKSKFSYQIVNSLLKQDAHVIYFSLEVQANQLIYNLMGNKFWKKISEINRMEIDDIDMWELFMKKLEVVTDKYQLDEILWYATMRKPDVIVIDFVQNIHSKWDEYQRMTDIAMRLQQFAIKNNIAVFDISQISNEWAKSTNTEVISSKWSGALVASADIALVMRRDKTDENIIVIQIAKNKFGWRKTLEYKVDFETWVFTEIGEAIFNKWI